MDAHLTNRQERLFAELPDNVTTVMIPPGATLYYFTGVQQSPRDRPILLVLSRDENPAFLLPALERGPVETALGETVDYYTYEDTAYPLSGAQTAFDALQDDRSFSRPIATEYRALRFLEYALFGDEYTPTDVIDLDTATESVRQQKDDREIEILREAAAITDQILTATIDAVEPGMTEDAVLVDLQKRILESKAEGLGVNVVTSGPRTGHAHAKTADRELRSGDLVLIDAGVVYKGYYSDISRTVVLGDANDWIRDVYTTVRQAAKAAREVVEPGVPHQKVDRAARDVIEDAGYGDAFPHRVGHGVGLEGHERPYLTAGNDTPLQPGETFTVEPGIYVAGNGGVRIEDMVLVTETGAEALTQTSRELQVV